MKDSLIFVALRDALWRNNEVLPYGLAEEETAELFVIVSKQAVSGLVMDAMIRHDIRMPQQRVFEMVGLLEQIRQQSRAINEGVVRLDNLMADGGIRYSIVKGQVVASYYPNPLIRQSGDIDYFCDAKNFPLSQEMVKKSWGIEAEREESELHVHYYYQGVTYEGHFSLANLYGKKRDDYWKRLIGNDGGATVLINGHQIKTLSPTVHTLYVFIHLYSHLLALGVGLRQFCDLAVMLHYCKEKVDTEALRVHLKTLGMERAYRACGSILVDYLGLPAEDLGYSLVESDRRYGKKIMDVVMFRGNMGHYNKKGGFSGWKHKIESFGIKTSHFMKFMPLAPEYSCGWLWHEVKRSLK